MVEGATEREAKLAAWPGFVLPDLAAGHDGISVSRKGSRKLDATYYDTDDLRLIRSGITLRHRSGGGAAEWTVKFPDADGSDTPDAMCRRELNVRGGGSQVPATVRALVAAQVRTAALQPVARLQTARRSFHLCDPDGTQLAEVDDDEVSVLDGRRVAARFREVEVELAPDAPGRLLDRLVERLTDAGAGASDQVPKLVRALGPRSLAPPELPVPEVDGTATAGAVLRAAIASSVRRVVDHHHVIVLDDDPEGVHQARVGTRRLRSDLRTFAPLLDTDRTDPIRDELKWLADRLGEVRDADVLRRRLDPQIADLGTDEDRRAGVELTEVLDAERARTQSALLEVLASDRYMQLLEDLLDLALDPPLTKRAQGDAGKVIPSLVARPWKKLQKEVASLGDDPTEEALHKVRVRAKRARYACDVAVPVGGTAAADAANALSNVQDVLGDHNDAAVAEAWLRGVAGEVGRSAAVVAGRLMERQRAESTDLREAWAKVWSKASAKKVWKWLE
jgi:CHAD domain-containing protein